MQKREVYIDKVKGLAIILIVLGHIILLKENVESKICMYIYTFHVPIFFIISGILISLKNIKEQNLNLKEYFIIKTKKFLYPYFSFSILFIIYLLIKFIFGYESIIKIIKIFLNTIFLFGYGPAWFLPTLLLSEIIFIMIIKKYNKSKKSIILFLFSIIWIAIWSNFLQSEFWQENFVLDFLNKGINLFTRSLIGCLFIFVGYMCNENKKIFDKIPTVIYTMLLILNIYISPINSQSDLHFCIINNMFLYFYLAISNAISIIKIIERCFNNKKTILSFWGENSLIIMLTHFTFPIMSCGLFFANAIIKISNDFLITSVAFIITLIIESLIIIFINSKFKILLKYK